MGFFNKLFGAGEKASASIATQSAPLTVCAPFTGSAMPLEQIPDPVFSGGVLGRGCGLEPEEETVYAPFDGAICQVTDTRHAIGIQSEDGIELLIHVGMDTVDMNGKSFVCCVNLNQRVKAGEPLMRFSRSEIKAAGHPVTTALIITNSDEFSDVALLADGEITHGMPLLRVTK